MACRIGITRDLDERKVYWQRQHKMLREWRVLHVTHSKAAAQIYETAQARISGCEAAPGGPGPETATWYVYYFEY